MNGWRILRGFRKSMRQPRTSVVVGVWQPTQQPRLGTWWWVVVTGWKNVTDGWQRRGMDLFTPSIVVMVFAVVPGCLEGWVTGRVGGCSLNCLIKMRRGWGCCQQLVAVEYQSDLKRVSLWRQLLEEQSKTARDRLMLMLLFEISCTASLFCTTH